MSYNNPSTTRLSDTGSPTPDEGGDGQNELKVSFDIAKKLFDLNLMLFYLLASPFDILLRFEHGERFLNWAKYILSYILLGILVQFATNNEIVATFAGTWLQVAPLDVFLFGLFVPAYVILSLYRKARCTYRTRTGMEHVVTTHWGDSYLVFLGDRITPNSFVKRVFKGLFEGWALYRLTEPLVMLLIGLVLLLFSPMFAIYLMASAIVFFIRNNMTYIKERMEILDDLDNQFMAKFRQTQIAAMGTSNSGYVQRWSTVTRIKPTHKEKQVLNVDSTVDKVMKGKGKKNTPKITTTPKIDLANTVADVMGQSANNGAELPFGITTEIVDTFLKLRNNGKEALQRAERRLMANTTTEQQDWLVDTYETGGFDANMSISA